MRKKDSNTPEDEGSIYNAGNLSSGVKILVAAAAAVLMAAAGLLFPMLLSQPQNSAAVSDTENNRFCIETPKSRYTTVDSSMPGMPIRIFCEASDNISISTDTGTLITYGHPDYKVKQHGRQLDIESGGTVYLSPIENNSEADAPITVNILALRSGLETGRAVIVIGYKDFYYAIESISVSY